MSLRRAQVLAAHSLTFAVPKNRRPKFDLLLKIVDLNNVPLVNGSSFVKWHLPHSNTADHRGRTEKRNIKDHKVVYDHQKQVQVRLTVDKNGMLQELIIHFEVIQEYAVGGRSEKITLGNVKLNLAEYVEPSEHEQQDGDGIVRRYLMQDSKINSTLKLGIYMKQIEGDRNFIAPPLKTAQVFGGIAGLITTDPHDTDENNSAPSLTNKSAEAGELQDMYRRTLAAHWAAQPGELKADACIEDIFAGGDGWGDRDATHGNGTHQTGHMDSPRLRSDGFGAEDGEEGSDSEAREHHRPLHLHRHTRQQSRGQQGHRRNGSEGYQRSPTGRKLGAKAGDNGAGPTTTGRASLEQQARQMKAEVERGRHRPSHEVDEFDVREDLRSWSLG